MKRILLALALPLSIGFSATALAQQAQTDKQPPPAAKQSPGKQAGKGKGDMVIVGKVVDARDVKLKT